MVTDICTRRSTPTRLIEHPGSLPDCNVLPRVARTCTVQTRRPQRHRHRSLGKSIWRVWAAEAAGPVSRSGPFSKFFFVYSFRGGCCDVITFYHCTDKTVAAAGTLFAGQINLKSVGSRSSRPSQQQRQQTLFGVLSFWGGFCDENEKTI